MKEAKLALLILNVAAICAKAITSVISLRACVPVSDLGTGTLAPNFTVDLLDGEPTYIDGITLAMGL